MQLCMPNELHECGKILALKPPLSANNCKLPVSYPSQTKNIMKGAAIIYYINKSWIEYWIVTTIEGHSQIFRVFLCYQEEHNISIINDVSTCPTDTSTYCGEAVKQNYWSHFHVAIKLPFEWVTGNKESTIVGQK